MPFRKGRRHRLRIVIADNDPDELCRVNMLLVRDYPGNVLTVFLNAEDAMRHVVAVGAELLIANDGIGKMSGSQLTSELRQWQIEIPIIIVSDNPNVREEALESGADSFVEKSQNTEKLEKEIKRLLTGKEMPSVALLHL